VHVSARDFAGAIRFIQAARAFPESALEFEALVESAIIRYARPFSPRQMHPIPALTGLKSPLVRKDSGR